MNLWKAIFLGALQGATEFLPISSSGHLCIASHLFSMGDLPVAFNVFLHFFTLIAVVVFFRRDILALLAVFFRFLARKSRPDDKNDLQTVFAILIATAITGILGVFLQKKLPPFPPKIVCAGFVATAFLLALSELWTRHNEALRTDIHKKSEAQKLANPSVFNALVLGAVQGLATLPGISRSGATISAGLFCGFERNFAGKLSFLMSIPAVFGAFLLEAKDFTALDVSPVFALAGGTAAFLTAICSLSVLKKIIGGKKLAYFAFYLILAGFLGLIFL